VSVQTCANAPRTAQAEVIWHQVCCGGGRCRWCDWVSPDVVSAGLSAFWCRAQVRAVLIAP